MGSCWRTRQPFHHYPCLNIVVATLEVPPLHVENFFYINHLHAINKNLPGLFGQNCMQLLHKQKWLCECFISLQDGVYFYKFYFVFSNDTIISFT